MRVSGDLRFIFVHIQKTGGSTIDSMLDAEVPDIRLVPGLTRHAGLADILKAEPSLTAYRSAAVVRNPWSRMVSWWSMIRQAAEGAAAGNTREVGRMRVNPWWARAAEMEFSEFVTKGVETWPRLSRTQLSYITAGRRRVDFVGRTETLDHDVPALRAWLGLPPIDNVPVFNASPHGDYREFYDGESVTRVGELFARDVAAFGYRF